MTVVKFPYSASRRAYSRRPRISKNGTPEERAAKAAGGALPRRSSTRSTTRDEIRARVRLIAAERNLPASEIKWIGRLKTYDCVSFSKRHRVSMDWLLTGDLKGLLETMRGCPSRPEPRPVLSGDELVAKMASLDQGGRQFIIDYINLLLAKRST